jgi:hypothetical protein
MPYLQVRMARGGRFLRLPYKQSPRSGPEAGSSPDAPTTMKGVMLYHLPLFDSVPYQRHSVTSQEAATEIAGSVASLRRKVYELIDKNGPLTDEEIQTALNMNPSTQRPRRIELVERDLVVDSGEKKKTKSGRWAVAWKASRKV